MDDTKVNTHEQDAPAFQGIPGMGTLLPKKALPDGNAFWQGPLTLMSGERVVMQSTLKAGVGGTVTILDPDENWEELGTFKLGSFGESPRAQYVYTTFTGAMKAYPSKTRDGQICVRVQILDARGRANIAMF